MRRRALCLLAAATLLGSACASKKVLVPPRVDLKSHGTLGLVEFSSEGAPELAELATDQLMAVIQSAQPGVPILELGNSRQVLASLDRDTIDPEAIRALGEQYGVDAVLVGELRMERARPSFSMSSFAESLDAGARVEGALSARLFQTRSGATVWTNAARGHESIARVGLSPGSVPRIDARDPQDAESRLVRNLVATLSGDFRSRWVKP